MNDVQNQQAAQAEEDRAEHLARLLCWANSVMWGDGGDEWEPLYETVKDGYRGQARWLLAHGVRLEAV